MRVTCIDCNKPTIVTHRAKLADGIDDIYCTCPHCGRRQVFTLAFKHRVEPATAADIAAALLRSLAPADRARVIGEQMDIFVA